MRSFTIAALVGTVTAAPATIFAVGSAPKCFVTASGRTVVEYRSDLHPSFKCSHAGSVCSCTVKHPTHHTGSCREFDHTDSSTFKIDGDCSDGGLNHIDGGWTGYSACSSTRSSACSSAR